MPPLTSGVRSSTPITAGPADRADGEVLLATWRQLLDGGTLLADEPDLAGTARPPALRVAPDTATRLGLVEGRLAALSGPRGTLRLPVELADLPEDVVWAPSHTPTADGVVTLASLGLAHGRPASVTTVGSSS